jgi:PBSX family phage portal protein
MAGAYEQAASSGDRGRGVILKARVLGSDAVQAQASRSDENEDLNAVFGQASVLKSPYNPDTLLRMWENSSALPQNVQSMVVNVDGMGHRFVMRVDLTSEESFEKVRDAVWLDRLQKEELANYDEETGEFREVENPERYMPSDDEVSREIEKLKIRARLEHARLSSFFEYVNPDGSFDTLRRQTRQDREITGNAYWEVLRDKQGRLSRFVGVPPTHVRLTSCDSIATQVEERVLVGNSWQKVTQHKFFRRYVQALHGRAVWFKEFGDPRVISRETGSIYPDLETFEKHKQSETDQPATEMIHFRIYVTGEAYGIPRWIGNMLAVLGSRASDEVNFSYFDNKAVPPLALLVSGGRLAEESVTKIETFIRDHIKGRENFHKILVIEGDTDTDPLGTQEHPKLALEKLTDAQQGDALFQKYDERNIDKVGSSFRIPRLLRGDVRDFNRATADASMRFADEQIFQPERNEFDSWVNRVLFPILGIKLWQFRSLGPQTRDPERVASIVVDLAKVGVLTPNEARDISGETLGRDLEPIAAGWAKQPLNLTLAGYPPPENSTTNRDPTANEEDDSVEGRLRRLTQSANAVVAGREAQQLDEEQVSLREIDDAADQFARQES